MSRIELPTLKALSQAYHPSGVHPKLILITHVLPTAVAYVEVLDATFDISLVAIPYSVNRLAAQRLRSTGHEVCVPSSLDDVAPSALLFARRANSAGQPVVVQEIGGYLADQAVSLAAIESFRGVVEDTNNGHWRYENRAELLTYPVISIAHSPIKALEDMQIGEAVAFSVERVLRHRLGLVLRCLRVLVLGFGSIGTSCAAAFHHRGADVAVYDVDPLKLMRAQASGYRVGEARSLVAQADVVIGATGRCSLDVDLAAVLRDGAVLASASSRQLEFDLAGLKREYRVSGVAPEIDRFSRKGRGFFLLNDGFPINFRDHSVVGRFLDAVYSELFVCIREVAEGRAKSGLHASWGALHREVGDQWCRAYLNHSNSAPVG